MANLIMLIGTLVAQEGGIYPLLSFMLLQTQLCIETEQTSNYLPVREAD